MRPYVSVIVPIYNAELYLQECVDSLLNQSLQNIEIFLIDDGSTDHSREIISQYSKSDHRIKVILQKNAGPSRARNAGIDAAAGQYITFVDADDWVDRDAYLALYSKAVEQDVDVVFTPLHYQFPDSANDFVRNYPLKANAVLNEQAIKRSILPDFLYSGSYGNPFKVYKSDLIKQYGILFAEDRSLGEDWLFNMDVFTYCKTVVYVNTPYYHYRQINSGSLMRKYRPQLFEFYMTKSPLEKYIKKWGLYNESVAIELLKRKCFVVLRLCILNEFKQDCKSSYIEKFKNIRRMLQHPDIKKAADILLRIEKNKANKLYLVMLKLNFTAWIFILGKLYVLVAPLRQNRNQGTFGKIYHLLKGV